MEVLRVDTRARMVESGWRRHAGIAMWEEVAS